MSINDDDLQSASDGIKPNRLVTGSNDLAILMPDDDFATAVRIAQAGFGQRRSDVKPM